MQLPVILPIQAVTSCQYVVIEEKTSFQIRVDRSNGKRCVVASHRASEVLRPRVAPDSFGSEDSVDGFEHVGLANIVLPEKDSKRPQFDFQVIHGAIPHNNRLAQSHEQ
jgi:hypothetical protein